MVDEQTMKLEILKMQTVHEDEIIEIRILTQAHQVDIFKENSEKIAKKFKMEIDIIHDQYDNIREKYFECEERVQRLLKFVNAQEVSMSEHRTFIFKCLEEIFTVVDDVYPEVADHLMNTVAEAFKMSEVEKHFNDPLLTYTAYLKMG